MRRWRPVRIHDDGLPVRRVFGARAVVVLGTLKELRFQRWDPPSTLRKRIR
jgi:hypothetical protein